MTYIELGIPDYRTSACEFSVEESRKIIDELMAYDLQLSEPFSEAELAELFKKVDTLAPLGFAEGMADAEQLDAKESQKKVDSAVEDLKICAERRKELDSALTEAELTELFRKRSWGSRRGWQDYELLTPEEQYFVDKSGWTPEKRPYDKSGLSKSEKRRKLKASIIKTPSFQSCQFHNLDKVKLLVMKHETTEKCFYFMNFFSSESIWTSSQKIAKLKTAMPFVTDDRTAALWLEVFDHITVDKNKLRPEQVKYLEAKVQKTLELLKKYKFDIYDDKHWDCPQNYYRNYKLLTKSEKQILDRLKLTPAPQEKCEDEDFFDDANDIVSARRDLKIDILRRNTDDIFSFLGGVGGFLNFGFTVYFARDCYWIYKAERTGISCCPQGPDLIVEKSKLRPDQITYLDRKCEEKDRTDAEKQNANKTDTVPELQRFFDDHGIDAEVVSKVSGPRITRYEIEPGIGVSPERIKDLQDEIQMVLQASSIRILAPIPGRTEVGIEVPNENPETVTLKGILYSEQWQNSTAVIPLAIGRNTVGEPVIIDLDHAPHILLAGAAGTGKRVCIGSMIFSMIRNFTPDELQFVMFKSKIVKPSIFDEPPHLQMPIVNDSEKFAAVLHQIADEMDKRLAMPSDEKIPHLVIIIDELAALLTGENKIAVETDIARIAQKGRKVGIHLIISTQYPMNIPVVIKVNITTKLCFQVCSESDSKLVLGDPGAEKLLGKGDMLMQYGLFTERVQGAY